MKYSDAENTVWKYSYTAKMNELYYERLLARWRNVKLTLNLTTLILSVVGAFLGLLSLVQALPPSVGVGGVGVSVISMLVTIALTQFSLEAAASRCVAMGKKWTKFLSECEIAQIDLEGVDRRSLIPLELAERIKELRRMKEEIDSQEREHPPWKKLLVECQREINKRNFHVRTGTYEEVMQKIEQDAVATAG